MSRCPALHLAQRPKKEAPLGPPAWRLRSEGDQGLQCRINRHQRLGRLLLKQHLGRQLSQPGIALSAECQIIEQLPAALLQAGFAGQRSHGRAPHRTLQPAGGGSRARPQLGCGAQRSHRQHRRARETLEAPPDHEEGRSGVRSGAAGCIAAALLAPMGRADRTRLLLLT